MTYKIFQPTDTHGRPRDGWSGTDLDARLSLCKIQQPTEGILLRNLPVPGIVLESGCGTGRWIRYLSERGITVVGLDSSIEVLVRSREAWDCLMLSGGDVLDLPFRDGSIAAVITLGVIEHFEEGPETFLSEIVRVLKPGGSAYITSPCECLCRTLLHRPAMRLVRTLAWLLHRCWVFTEYRYGRRPLRRMIEASGLEVEAVHPEDLEAPDRDFALNVDWLCIFKGEGEFGLNLPGRLAKRLQAILPHWWHASAILFECRKPG